MTAKEQLIEFVERLDEQQANDLLEELGDAADRSGQPLSKRELESVRRGLADIAAGRTISLDEFNRQNPV